VATYDADSEDVRSLLGAIDTAESHSYGFDDSLSDERALAIRYYLGENVEPAESGRSQVVDRSIYETVQWITPSLSRIFANGDDVVELPPVGPEDEEASKQEAQYLNYIVLQRNNWFEIFNTAAKDALLSKAGYLYPYREKRRQVEIEKYERQTQEGVALIMQDKPEVLSMKEYPDPDYVAPPPQPMMQMGPQGPAPMMGPDGQPIMQPPPPTTMLYDLEIRRTKEDTRFCILVLPPERVRVAKTTTTVQVRDSEYFEYYDYPTISELRQEGYEVADDIGRDDFNVPPEDAARDQYAEDAWSTDERTDPASRRVKCRWVWIRHDFDQDGIAELQYVVRVGQTILYREEVNRIPIGVLCGDPLPHRHIGQGVADTTLDIQRIKTAILRQGLDNLYQTNNTRTFANPDKIALDDLLVSRPGGIVRGRNGAVYGQDIMPIQVPFVFPQAMEGLAYMDSVKETRVGVNSNFTGLDKESLSNTQSGVAINQLSTMAAQRVEQIARHFANGIVEMFSILHEIVLKSGHKTETVKLRGKWVEVNPAEWRSRSDFKISVGYAAGNKDAMIARLQMIGMQQMQALQLGLPVVQPRNIYETNIELAKAADMSTPEKFFTDPATVPPPGPPQPDPTVMAAEQMKTQSAERVKAAELQSEERLKQAELAHDKYKADLASQTAVTVEQMKQHHAGQIEQFRAQHQVGMKQFEGNQTLQLEQHRANLNPKNIEATAKAKESNGMLEMIQGLAHAHQQHGQMLQQMLHAITAPKRIVRGKDGRATHVETVSQ